MNCKQGDLAVIVRSIAGNEGKIVRCLELDPAHHFLSPALEVSVRPAWRVDRLLPAWSGCTHSFVADCNLRPIRGDEGDDETLAWAGKPEGVTS